MKKIVIVGHINSIAIASHIAQVMAEQDVDIEIVEVAPQALEVPLGFDVDERRFMEPVPKERSWRREQAKPPRPKDLYKKGRRL